MTLLFSSLAALLGAAALSGILTLLVLLAAAWTKRRPADIPTDMPPLRLAVIVPAHNEELVLAGTLNSLLAQNYPSGLSEIVVVADNCTDRTTMLARERGVLVLERFHDTERGKGYALNHAVSYLLAAPIVPDGFVVVDADTEAAPDFLARMNTRLQSEVSQDGYGAWQGRYGVLNAADGWRAALMASAFDLVNHVKPLGRDALRLSVGLKGNGMAFTRALAEVLPWPGSSLTEDLDYSLELARRFGLRVGYAPEARVRAQMPATSEQAASQRRRWERGRLALIRERALPLLGEAVQRRSLLLLDMAWDLLVPPMAELAALLTMWLSVIALGTALHLLPHPLLWIGLGGFGAFGLLTYVLGGLRAAEAPPEAYKALARAPFYAVWKFALLLSGRRGKRSSTEDVSAEEWVRTARTPISSDVSVPTPTEVNAP